MRCILQWFYDYDRLQTLAVILLYIQVACALVGSLGALYTGVLLANLAIAFFALVAIESGSQTLGRTYAALLPCALVLDVIWFFSFFYEIRESRNSEQREGFVIFSLELVLWMEIAGFVVRTLSALVWIQLYRLGPSPETESRTCYRPLAQGSSTDNNTPVSSPTVASQTSDDILGGSIYDPTYYSSVFRIQENASKEETEQMKQRERE